MARTDMFIKVTVDLDTGESPERLASEICRQIENVYGVRSVELSNFVTQSE